jgi:hypothetical protein
MESLGNQLGMGGVGQASPEALKRAYQAQRNYQPSAPKEIGFLTRAEGLCTGLDELHGRLQGLTGRIAGSGVEAGSSPSAPCTSGLHAALSMAEDRLRECLKLLDKLNDAF